jgi:hypothetical protein
MPFFECPSDKNVIKESFSGGDIKEQRERIAPNCPRCGTQTVRIPKPKPRVKKSGSLYFVASR